MSEGRRYLFVCGKNRHRSPTAEQIFASHPGLAVLSAGLAGDSDLPLDSELVEWADRIFVMESRHRGVIERRFADSLCVPIVVLGIRDEFQFMDGRLVAILQDRMSRFLP